MIALTLGACSGGRRKASLEETAVVQSAAAGKALNLALWWWCAVRIALRSLHACVFSRFCSASPQAIHNKGRLLLALHDISSSGAEEPEASEGNMVPATVGPSRIEVSGRGEPGLHIIGLGLGDEKDVTVRGLELIKAASQVFLEAYTSILSVSVEQLQKFYGCQVTVADREFVEERAHIILDAASRPGGAAFLVVGDPFGATTHSDLWLRARERLIPVNVVHNASIMNAVAVTGLQLYQFGQAISVCFWTETDRPTSYYPKLVSNRNQGMHTLCLLDIKVKEPSLESLARGKKVFEPPRYMTINQAVEQLLDIDKMLDCNELDETSMAVGVARIGQPDQIVRYASLSELRNIDFGAPLHSLIIPARELHFHELEVLNCFRP
ncbi:unnamed protein product [Agarophyton chilense]